MKDEKNNSDNMENKAQKFFQKRVSAFKIGKDFWSKLEPRLNEKQNTAPAKRKESFWQWLAGPRLVAISSTLGVLVILVTAGSLWLTNNKVNQNTAGSIDEGAIAKGAGGNYGIYTTATAVTLTNGMIIPQTTLAAMTTITSAPSFSGGITLNPISTTNSMDTTGAQVISQASVALEVSDVATAVNQVETLAQNLGGSVDNMSSSGSQNQQQANLTIRVPANQFLTALNQLQTMGTVQSQNINTQDVTQQYIDLQAQLTSAQLEEQNLQAILAKATTVSDEIAIQEQLTQVISQVESLQGQINYMQNQVTMSTITVNLNTPTQNVGQAPSGSLTVEVGNVDNIVASVKQLVASVNGIINSSQVSFDNGKESASLTMEVYRDNFDQVMTTLGKKGKIDHKTIQESTGTQSTGTQGNTPPDAMIYLTLIQATGFWTAAHVTIIIAGAVILVVLIIIIAAAGRAGLLRKKKA
jgi:hypothetical protein